ncbi:MAG: lytic transglycosylase domain-containing protein [Bacteroides sp.]|nr:lytic transglycosylase domain-containing protein [Bacteroides sp.]MCM1548668.1 lytic transglycosylase domain-containing protein [Clostridium sp.]
MAYVSSMTYTTEAQFLEAVAQAKSAQTAREAALASAAMEQGLSFQAMLNSSIAGYSGTIPAASSAAVDSQALDVYFQQAADTYNISVDLLKAVARQESGFQTNIVSSAGAIGVMQLMPGTAAYLGVTDPYNAEQNIMGGAKLLSELSARYNGDLSLTLAAYNAGAGAVDKYGTVPPYQETQNFVAKIKASLGVE